MIVADARSAFVTGMHHGVIVGAGSPRCIGAVVVAIWLPARAAAEEVFEQQDAAAAAEAAVDVAVAPAMAGDVV